MNRRELLKHSAALAVPALLRQRRFAAALPFSWDSPAEAARLARDPRRPQFHLLPAANWMNDPNGPIYWNGQYHMFFQYNPDGAYWGDMHWAHAVGPDMVHWKHLPVALSPTPGGPDAAGCFSGTSVVDHGVVTALYTGVVHAPEDEATIRDGANSLRESQCLATSTDPELKTWTKFEKPVIAAPPAGMHVTGFRDPSPWRSGDWWYMTVGSGIPHKGGAVLLYRSKDLRNWEYLHLLTSGFGIGKDTGNPVDSGDMWECPDFFPLGDKHVLIYAAEGRDFWQSGVLDHSEMRFHPEQHGILDYGTYYAAKTQLDKDGDRILWGWINETRPLAQYKAAGWAGMMSLPRVLTLRKNGQLNLQVSRAVHTLRGKQHTLTPGAHVREQLTGMALTHCCGEILCSIASRSSSFTLSLRGRLPQGQMQEPLVTLTYNSEKPGEIRVDDRTLPVNGLDKNELELQVYVDGSVAELIVDRAAAYTKRFYYDGPQAPAVSVQFDGSPAALRSLSMWQIEPISPDRLTR